MKRWGKRIGFALLILLALFGLGRFFSSPLTFEKSVGVVEVSGTMWTGDEWVSQLEKFRKDEHIGAVVLRVQSPGGVVAAAQEVFEAVRKTGETKPVVASMGSLAASGGFYIAMGAKTVVADPGTLTGSIGVRMEHFNIADLLRRLGVEYSTIKSGAFKDLGSPTRPLSSEERALLNEVMEEIHLQFKEVVAEARGLPLELVQKFADGRIFTGAKAKELGLVDHLGGMTEAVRLAAEAAGIKGEPRVVFPEEPGLWWMKAFFGAFKSFLRGPQFCFLM